MNEEQKRLIRYVAAMIVLYGRRVRRPYVKPELVELTAQQAAERLIR